jgi:hypothetical protein
LSLHRSLFHNCTWLSYRLCWHRWYGQGPHRRQHAGTFEEAWAVRLPFATELTTLPQHTQGLFSISRKICRFTGN